MINWDIYEARLGVAGDTGRDRAVSREREAILRKYMSSPSLKTVSVNGEDMYLLINSTEKSSEKKFNTLPNGVINIGDIVLCMVNSTYLDELVDYPRQVILRLLKQQMILDLLANKRNAEIEDMEDDNGKWKYFFDYEHIPETVQEVKAAFCVDTDIVSVPNGSIKRLELYVSCYCSQAFMPLDGKIFKGLGGNRINNLMRYADLALRKSRDFGIGQLELKNARTVTSGNAAFAKKMLTYAIPDFNLLQADARSSV